MNNNIYSQQFKTIMLRRMHAIDSTTKCNAPPLPPRLINMSLKGVPN